MGVRIRPAISQGYTSFSQYGQQELIPGIPGMAAGGTTGFGGYDPFAAPAIDAQALYNAWFAMAQRVNGHDPTQQDWENAVAKWGIKGVDEIVRAEIEFESQYQRLPTLAEFDADAKTWKGIAAPNNVPDYSATPEFQKFAINSLMDLSKFIGNPTNFAGTTTLAKALGIPMEDPNWLLSALTGKAVQSGAGGGFLPGFGTTTPVDPYATQTLPTPIPTPIPIVPPPIPTPIPIVPPPIPTPIPIGNNKDGISDAAYADYYPSWVQMATAINGSAPSAQDWTDTKARWTPDQVRSIVNGATGFQIFHGRMPTMNEFDWDAGVWNYNTAYDPQTSNLGAAFSNTTQTVTPSTVRIDNGSYFPSDTQQTSALASGGRVTQPGMYTVGEQGPELAWLPPGAVITPLNASNQNMIGRLPGMESGGTVEPPLGDFLTNLQNIRPQDVMSSWWNSLNIDQQQAFLSGAGQADDPLHQYTPTSFADVMNRYLSAGVTANPGYRRVSAF